MCERPGLRPQDRDPGTLASRAQSGVLSGQRPAGRTQTVALFRFRAVFKPRKISWLCSRLTPFRAELF